LRDTSGSCSCYVCLTGSSKANIKNKGGRGKSNNQNNIIIEGQGLNGSSVNKLPSARSGPLKQPDCITICKSCMQEVGRGLGHNCKPRNSSENLLKHLDNLVPEVQKEKVISSVLKTKAAEMKGDNDLKLSTQGRKMRVSINPSERKEVKFTLESLDNLQGALGNISDRQMNIHTNWLKCTTGKSSVPAKHKQHMSERSKELSFLYKKDNMVFDGYGKTQVTRPVVWADAKEVVQAISKCRSFDNPIIKVMADGGQKFLKFCVTILPGELHNPDYEDKENLGPLSKKARSTFRQ
jgi:hypothetical protein